MMDEHGNACIERMRHQAGLDTGGQSELERKAALGEKAMRTLESLTPSGSEFVNDPERCAAWVKEVRSHQWKAIVRFNLERDSKAGLVEELVGACKDALEILSDSTDDTDEFLHATRKKLVAAIAKTQKVLKGGE